MTDLVRLLDSLVDNKGNILIDGVNEDVKPVTEEEEELYKDIDFNPVSKETSNSENVTVIFFLYDLFAVIKVTTTVPCSNSCSREVQLLKMNLLLFLLPNFMNLS